MGLFILNGKNASFDEDEVQLGTPDMVEAKSLERHVERCALRWRFLNRQIYAMDAKVSFVRGLLFIILAWLVLTSSQFWTFFKTMTGI